MSSPELNEALLAEQSSIEQINEPSIEDGEIKIQDDMQAKRVSIDKSYIPENMLGS